MTLYVSSSYSACVQGSWLPSNRSTFMHTCVMYNVIQTIWSKKANRLSVQIIKVLHRYHLTGLKMLCVKALLFERLLTPCPKLYQHQWHCISTTCNVCGSYGVFKVHDCPHSVIKSTNLYTHVWCTMSYRQSDQRKQIVYKSSETDFHGRQWEGAHMVLSVMIHADISPVNCESLSCSSKVASINEEYNQVTLVPWSDAWRGHMQSHPGLTTTDIITQSYYSLL